MINSKAVFLVCLLVFCMGVASYSELLRLTTHCTKKGPFEKPAAKTTVTISKYRVIK